MDKLPIFTTKQDELPIFPTKKDAHKYNREMAPILLKKNNIKFTSHNNGAHLVLYIADEIFDFWPGPNKYISRKTKEYGYEINELLKKYEKESKQ